MKTFVHASTFTLPIALFTLLALPLAAPPGAGAGDPLRILVLKEHGVGSPT